MIKKYKKYIFLIIFVLCSLIYINSCVKDKDEINFEGLQASRESSEASESPEFNLSEDTSPEAVSTESGKESIFVYICGEIVNPGVYELNYGARMGDLVLLAGGFTENANINYNNLALKLADEQKVYIPSMDEALSTQEASMPGQSEASTGKVNINKAGIEELMTLKGIGKSKAEKIIEYRNENGGFKSAEDIMKINGIKKSAFDKIKDSICIE